MAYKIEKEILVDNGVRKYIIELYHTTYPTVRTALKYQSKTALAHKIRKTAIECGGVVVTYDKQQTPTL